MAQEGPGVGMPPAPEAQPPIMQPPVTQPQPPQPPVTQPQESSAADNLTKKLEQIPTMSDEDREKINNYLDEALHNYEEILENEKGADARNTEIRIKNNERLAKDYEQRLAESEARLRKIKSTYLRQYEGLKKARSSGKLDEKSYDIKLQKLLKEYRTNLNDTLKDRAYAEEQGKKAQERLAALQEIKRINDLLRDEEQVMVEEQEPEGPRAPAHELDKLLLDIRQTGCFEVKNFCTSPEFK